MSNDSRLSPTAEDFKAAANISDAQGAVIFHQIASKVSSCGIKTTRDRLALAEQQVNPQTPAEKRAIQIVRLEYGMER